MINENGFDLMKNYPVINRETTVADGALASEADHFKAPILFNNFGFSHTES